MAESRPILDDVLVPGLKVVFCGTAPGHESARRRAYYAGPGNRFWPTLHATGLTPHRLAPEDFRELPTWGIGLTDLVKHTSGMDHDLVPDDYDPAGLAQRIAAIEPGVLCFNGKQAARTFLGQRRVELGLHPTARIGPTRIFVAPSTSGRATMFWDVTVWHELARLIRSSSR